MFSVYLDDPAEQCGPTDIGLHCLGSIEGARWAAEEHHGGPLLWTNPMRGESPSASTWHPPYQIVPVKTPQEDTVTEQPADIQTLVQNEIEKALGGISQHLGVPAPAQTFDEVLDQIDPADSEAALAMLDYLLRTGRLGRVGVLDGGQGYLFMYQEPKGSTKEGYRPGATQGDRIVDEAVEAQRAAGARPAKRSMCSHCYAVVREEPDLDIVTDDELATPVCPNSADGKHAMA